MYVQLLARARRHGYALRRATLEALGETWEGWEVEGITPPAAFLGDAGLTAWLDALDRGRPVEAAAPDEQLAMEWAA
jgi:hypothetical protein